MKKRPVTWRELGVAQMLADDFHLTFQEAVPVLVVAVLLQFGPEWGAFSHPSVKALQGCGGFPSRAIKKRCPECICRDRLSAEYIHSYM